MKAKQIQWQLFFLGYYGSDLKDIDGIYGPKTTSASLRYQQDYFTAPEAHDGIFGDSSAAKSREVIDNIQDILKTVVPDLKDDGLAGPKTMDALKLWQESQGLPQTGRVDTDTWVALMEGGYGYSLPDPEEDATISKIETPTEESTATGTFWDQIQYFTRQEMRCKCGQYCNGFPAEPQKLLMELADRARAHLGKPAHNISCLRCPTWNALQGGVANSQHMYGEAMDIRIDGVTADKLLAFFQQQPEVRYCYKINSTNVHFDIPKSRR